MRKGRLARGKEAVARDASVAVGEVAVGEHGVELRVQHAIRENMWDEMGEMGQAIKDEAYGDLYDFFRYVDKMEAATKEGKPKDKSISTATGAGQFAPQSHADML